MALNPQILVALPRTLFLIRALLDSPQPTPPHETCLPVLNSLRQAGWEAQRGGGYFFPLSSDIPRFIILHISKQLSPPPTAPSPKLRVQKGPLQGSEHQKFPHLQPNTGEKLRLRTRAPGQPAGTSPNSLHLNLPTPKLGSSYLPPTALPPFVTLCSLTLCTLPSTLVTSEAPSPMQSQPWRPPAWSRC